MHPAWLLSFLLLVLLVSSVQAQAPDQQQRKQQPTVPALFVFGDSLVDSGNNKFLTSLSQANQSYNGIDFPSGATGRFCNGFTVTDIVAQQLGLPLTPPYLDPNTKGSVILKGVNYASGGAGILDATGLYFLQRLPLRKQVEYFNNTRLQIIGLVGKEAATRLISKSIFTFIIGSNDYLNNYVAPVTASPFLYTPQQFQEQVVNTYQKLLVDLYNLDARKMVIAGAGPIGCIPYQLTVNLRRDGSCAPLPNQLIRSFNKALRTTVLGLDQQLPGVHVSFVNTYDSVTSTIRNAKKYGFETATVACCGAGGPYRGLISCNPSVSVCRNRSSHFFWDPYHPSQAANYILAGQIMDGDASVIEPMNIRQLAKL